MLVGVATLVFSLIHLVPGDPVQAMLGDSASPEDMAEMRTRLGLDRPLVVQYAAFVKGVATGDLGTSLRTNRAVITDITDRLPATFELAGAAMTAAILIALPLGIVAAVWAGTRVDHAATTLALVGMSSADIGWAPSSRSCSLCLSGGSRLSGRGTCLRTWSARDHARRTAGGRAGADDTGERAGRAPRALCAGGTSTRRVAGCARYQHAFRNSLIPIVTVLGLQFGAVLTGAVITETIFAWPGVGRLLIQSISFRDYPAVQGCILLIAVTYVSMNLLVDLVYGFLDPRIRYE